MTAFGGEVSPIAVGVTGQGGTRISSSTFLSGRSLKEEKDVKKTGKLPLSFFLSFLPSSPPFLPTARSLLSVQTLPVPVT